MSVLPEPAILSAFVLASLVLIVTPGPDMTLFLGQTINGGRARGFASMLGATAGLLVHSMLAAFGLSALLVASATAFTVIKVAGAGYLLWLAVQAIRHGSSLSLRRGPPVRTSLYRAFAMGFGVNLLNPKIVMFFLTFLPQFVSASDPDAPVRLLMLGLLYALLTPPVCAPMILGAERFAATMRNSPRLMRGFDWLFAGLMGAFAARLLFARAN
ncbi:MAG: LysE family translocator [Pseudorhodoplanes sp.]|uniref:LysE family translocator n=1 Tax=Pseudorhodoplanes sp. TaxID=1934341 RepID=UPI003D0D1A73